MNFRIVHNPQLEELLIQEAEKVKIINIKGHYTNPGIRISMYNAMPIQGVECLCNLLRRFQIDHPVQARL